VKKLVAILGGVAAAIGFSAAFCPAASADPGCPFDMSTQQGQAAFQQAIVASSQQIGQSQQSYGPNGNQAAAIGDINNQRNMSNIILACQNIQSTPLAPVQLPKEPEPPVQQPDDGRSPVDCTKLRGAYDSLGPVLDAGDAAEKINHLKIPGLSQVTGASLALCTIDAVPAAIANPDPENQRRVADGFCGSVNQFTNGIIDVCGDTPVGSN
jgi:hypothetical protein